MKVLFLASLSLAITAALSPLAAASAAAGAAITRHADAAAFQRVLADRGIDNLRTEDFEDSFARFLPSNEFAACIEPVSMHSNDACFAPGGMPAGVHIRSGSRFGVIVLGTEILGSQSLVGGGWPYRLSPSSINDTVLEFDNGPTVISLDVYGFGIVSGHAVGSAPITIEVFDTAGGLLDSFVVQGSGPGDPIPVGIESNIPIGRVQVGADIQAAGAMIDNLVFGGGAAALTAVPVVLEFGAVAAGDVGVQPVTFTNSGYLAADVGTIAAPGAPFVLDQDGCSGSTLAPGESCTVWFAFTPAFADRFQTTISVPLPAPGRDGELALAGTGYAAGGAP